MPKSLQQLQEQISKLQSEAEKLKRAEAADVIAQIKLAIDAYDLTPADLFGNKAVAAKRSAGSAVSAKKASKSKSKSKLSRKAQFADGAGNEWVGRGPRPLWLREALANGKTLTDFAVKG